MNRIFWNQETKRCLTRPYEICCRNLAIKMGNRKQFHITNKSFYKRFSWLNKSVLSIQRKCQLSLFFSFFKNVNFNLTLI